ncbi:MAG: hypothetical protein D3924_09570 [Candidatus Electrothrix sp. AR4]|nr:hypothetical protein [Candidatus Electrothrix sp. AR4]
MTILLRAAADKPHYQDDLWKEYRTDPPPKLPRFAEPKPSGTSFRFYCTFTLQSPFFSGRDRAGKEKQAGNEHDPTLNNHLCRDWISGSPLAKAGAWKRLFRTCWPKTAADLDPLDRLFGPESEDLETKKKKPGKAELKFHHAVFSPDSTGKALIAPRNSKTGKVSPGPITYEVVNPKRKNPETDKDEPVCCTVVIDYLPRDLNADEAGKVLVSLHQAAEEANNKSIGGKSGIWGRIRLTSYSINPGSKISEAAVAEVRGQCPETT